jgi:serine/threonine protein kinase
VALLEEARQLRNVLQVRLLADRMVRVLASLHSHGVVWGDLKPENLVMFADERLGTLTMRSIDLDTAFPSLGRGSDSRSSSSASPSTLRRVAFTARYAAPEVVRAASTGALASLQPAFPQDLWSLGMALYELFTGGRPYFADESPQGAADTRRALCSPGFAVNLSAVQLSEARATLASLLRVDPAARGDGRTLMEMLSHRWKVAGGRLIVLSVCLYLAINEVLPPHAVYPR